MSMEIIKYENTICSIDPNILTNDEYTFSVLSRTLSSEGRLTLTDNDRYERYKLRRQGKTVYFGIAR